VEGVVSARLCRLEVVRGDDGWFWRYIASNGKELARSSETYVRRAGCDRCAALTLGIGPRRFLDGVLYRGPEHFVAHVLDERGAAS
jgi:hypothetical protein